MMREQASKIEAQGSYKKILCLCTSSVLRSPTAAHILSSPPFNYNTRCAGTEPIYALIPLDSVLMEWADEVVCMEKKHASFVPDGKKVVILDIPNDFTYRQPELVKLIEERYRERS